MKNWEEFYRKLHTYFNGIIAISLLPFVFLFLELDTGEAVAAKVPDSWNTWLIILLTIPIAIILFITHRRSVLAIGQIDESTPLKDKLTRYLQIQTKRFLMMEVASVLCVAGLYFSNNYLFVFIYVFILFLFSLIRPAYDSIVRQLKLTKKERAVIESKKDFEP